jgi:uncharacterized protein
LHDCVHVPVTSPDRPRASVMAGDAAVAQLRAIGYPAALHEAIHHAIAAHSFSAKIPPVTLEAQVVQDADRLDAIGAIGVARCLMLGGQLGRVLYDADDPFAERRAPSDAVSSIDHFYTKLLTLAGTMQTASGRREAARRTAFMHTYLGQLRSEIRGRGMDNAKRRCLAAPAFRVSARAVVSECRTRTSPAVRSAPRPPPPRRRARRLR